MKYRIIHEVDGNNEAFYQVQFYEEHWYGRRWEYATQQICDGRFYIDARYDTLEQANHRVNVRNRTRSIVAQGIINVPSTKV